MKIYTVIDTREINELDNIALFLNEEDAETYKLSNGIEQFAFEVRELEVTE